nr:hypothetical protein FFPRI1PSEUD_18360 [Pseudomonas sp. FFPRI_1]
MAAAISPAYVRSTWPSLIRCGSCGVRAKRPMPMAIISAMKLASRRSRGDMVRVPEADTMTVRLELIDFL